MPINFPSDTTQPWYNTDNGITYVYANDAWRSTSASVNLNAHYVEVAGDTMTGGLSFRDTDGSIKTTLLTNGSAEFDGDVDPGRINVRNGGRGNSAIRTFDASGNQVFRAYGEGGVWIGDSSGAGNIQLNGNGSATFAGSVSTFGPLIVDRASTSSSVLAGKLNGTETLEIRADGSATFATVDGDAKIRFNTDGSAEFAGNVQVGEFDGNDYSKEGSYIYQSGQFRVARIANPTDPARVFSAFESGTQTVDIRANGSAEFNGNIVRRYSNDEYISIGNNATDVLRYRTDGSANGQKVLISKDGTASFEGGEITLGAVPGVAGPGTVIATQYLSDQPVSANQVFIGRSNGVDNIQLFGNGGAEFKSDVQVSSIGSVTSTTAGGVYIGEFGQVVVNAATDKPEDARVFLGKNKNAVTSEIFANGAAGFTGNVVTGKKTYEGNGVTLYHNGHIYVQQSEADETAFAIIHDDNTSPHVKFTANGSAEFKGVVKQAKDTKAIYLDAFNTGSNTALISVNNDGTTLGCRAGSGAGVGLTNGATAWTPLTSESRLKNIQSNADVDQCWNLVRDIQLKRFYYKDQEDKTGVSHMGPMADWLGVQDPELLIDTGLTDENGPIHTYNQGLLDMKALQALSSSLARIETLEQRVTDRDAVIADLTTRIQTLEGGNN